MTERSDAHGDPTDGSDDASTRKIDDPDVQASLQQFERELTDQQADATAARAQVTDLWDDRRRDPRQNDTADGIVLLLETTTGARFTEWVRTEGGPRDAEWLYYLLAYLEIDLAGDGSLADLLHARVPIQPAEDDDARWQLNWRRIEQVAEAGLEVADDG